MMDLRFNALTALHFLAIVMRTQGLPIGINTCYNELGDDNKDIVLICDASDRTALEVTWFKDNAILDIDEVKYFLNRAQNRLTIRNIVATDEGNYTCSYTAGPIQQTSSAGCLIVYGKASFASCYVPSCREDAFVNNNGTVSFDLRLTFSTSGRTGLLQNVVGTMIMQMSDVLLTIRGSSINTGDRNWTVEGNSSKTRYAMLHNAIVSDRGEYAIKTELLDPATGSLSIISKRVLVKALECNSPPDIINGTVSTNGHNHIVSSKATYSCNSGYSLIGPDTLTCIQKGSGAFWDQEVPTCSKLTPTIVSEGSVMFQLQIGPTDDCTCWNDEKSKHFLTRVKEQISAGISDSCNCTYNSSSINEVHLYCSQFPKYVTVRGLVSGTEDYTAEEIRTHMDLWRSKPSSMILSECHVLDINKNCGIHISYWNEVECEPPTRVETCQCNHNQSLNDTKVSHTPL